MTFLARDIWSRELGLAASPLFGGVDTRSAHSAMLDGVAGSFVFSDATADEGFDARARNCGADWSWSCMMRNHVLLDQDTITVTQAESRSTQAISRSSVEQNLELFLTHLERSGTGTEDVIDHIIGSFQSLRSDLPGEAEDQLVVFLSLLSLKLQNSELDANSLPDLIDTLPALAEQRGLPLDAFGKLVVNKDLSRRFFEDLLTNPRTNRSLQIDLTLRHAGSELFQAAQLVPPPPDGQGRLFGMSNVRISVRPHSLKGVAYTPIGLARILAEQTISARIGQDTDIVIADYACGSGSFLIEALAALDRFGWKGNVRLIGYDTSPTAIIATQFAIACAACDYQNLKISTDIRQQNFLDPEFTPEGADIVLMNPPYLAWADMDIDLRSQMTKTLGSTYKNRPDLSTAFVQRALECAKANAIVTTLIPVGVVANESSRIWRARISEMAIPRLIAVLGDHTLFRFATVNVAAVMLEKDGQANLGDAGTRMIWSSEVAGAASSALRELRRSPAVPTVREGESGRPWNIYSLLPEEVSRRPSWLPSPMLLPKQAADRLRVFEHRIEDLFDIRTGIRAGDRAALIISAEQWSKLKPSERKGFQPIAEKQAIADGTIKPVSYFFTAGNELQTEEELAVQFPTYYEEYLKPAKAVMSARKRTSLRWWLPSEARNSWRERKDARIVSRQWFKNDGFAVDSDGQFAVVQGYAWFPSAALKESIKRNYHTGDICSVLMLYCVLFASDIFFKVAREYSTNSAGGQINLQQNFIKNIPVPNIPETLATVPGLIEEVASWESQFPDLDYRNHFAARIYGFDLQAFF